MIDEANETQSALSEYLRQHFTREFEPPTVLDCMVELWVTAPPDGAVMPVRIVYRKRTAREMREESVGVVIHWR